MSNEDFKPVLLARLGKPNSHKLENYKADGGYQALAKALAMKNTEVIDVVKASGLRGRGGAGLDPAIGW